ncbi:MAG: insulinase family protein, partial [Candidatus Krumholzibacteria bacterium]|nr:insulinase family protein [Candidatus Krumholzibacteria bacterium]
MKSRSALDNVVKSVLPNGLTVLVQEDRSNPVVAINVWFGVGSVNESDDTTGLAHFQEHMVFKGTKRHGVGDIANLIKSAGGNLNAATSYSYTMYYVVLPAPAFSLGLDVQADAMMNSTFDPNEFKKERLVVIDEARMYDDTPDAYMFYRMMELGYKIHNYRRPIAGYEKVVSQFTRDQLVDFYHRYYRPANAVLTVVGDVDQNTATAEIERIYGGWKNGRVHVSESPAEPPQTEFRFQPRQGSVDHAYMGIGFHVPSILDADYPALEMLSTLLGSGKSSRLYRHVIEKKQLATTARSTLLAERWPGYFMFFASTVGNEWTNMCDAVLEELTRFQHEPAAEDELLKARRQVQKMMYNELETVEGQASNLGYYQLLGDYRLADEHREAIRAVTPEQIMSVARKYFIPGNCSVVSYLPDRADTIEPTRDEVEDLFVKKMNSFSATKVRATPGWGSDKGKQQEPEASAVEGPIATKPMMKRLVLDNGVVVLVKRRTTVPTVSMLTVFQGGSRLDPPGKSGLSMLATRALLKGTRSYSGDDIVNTIEGLGGSVDTISSFDVTGALLSVLSEYVDDALPVYKELIREPAFSGKKVEGEKARLLKELAKRHDHPIYVTIDELFANVFGDHPYAYPFVGEDSQLAALSDRDCVEWYKTILTPKNIVAVFVGDISEEKAVAV